VAPAPVTVLADAAQLRHAVVNLAINAQDAMPQGGTLRLTLTGDEAQRVATLEVEDSGCGMSEAVAQQVFEPFFTTKGAHEGTGLGLATVYGTVAQHGGTITLRSTPDVGTRFTLTFPLVEAAVAPSPEPPAPPRAPSRPRGGGRARPVLVVDDEPRLRQLIVRFLQTRGTEVIEAATAEEALERCEALPDPPSVVLSDVDLPAMDGLALLQALRARFPGLPMIAMSGSDYETVMPGGTPAVPGLRFLQKPFSNAELEAQIDCLTDAEPGPEERPGG
jgi:CheY-like chemotaxis protein